MAERVITAEDRANFEAFARQMGAERPDMPNPYKKGSGSWFAFEGGREVRLLRDMAWNRR